MTFAEAVRQYEKRCEACDVPAETVMAFLVEIAQTERYNLYLHYDEEMPEDLAAKFSAGMERILKQEPMAHVLGYSWFYGYKFTVNGDVLIPRPETEELCARILAGIDRCFPQGDVACVDVGTGDRAEKIRTYNYPQNRVTDHRIGFTITQLDRVMEGRLQDVIDALQADDEKKKLESAE